MLAWALIVFLVLWLVLRDVDPVKKAKLMGNPMLIHTVVIGSTSPCVGGAIHCAGAHSTALKYDTVLQRRSRGYTSVITGRNGDVRERECSGRGRLGHRPWASHHGPYRRSPIRQG